MAATGHMRSRKARYEEERVRTVKRVAMEERAAGFRLTARLVLELQKEGDGSKRCADRHQRQGVGEEVWDQVSGNQNWEDLVSGGDRDFNDANFMGNS